MGGPAVGAVDGATADSWVGENNCMVSKVALLTSCAHPPRPLLPSSPTAPIDNGGEGDEGDEDDKDDGKEDGECKGDEEEDEAAEDGDDDTSWTATFAADSRSGRVCSSAAMDLAHSLERI